MKKGFSHCEIVFPDGQTFSSTEGGVKKDPKKAVRRVLLLALLFVAFVVGSCSVYNAWR